MAADPGLFRRGLMRALGVRTISDVYERICELGVRPPTGARRKAWLGAIEDAGILFIHIPKAADTSINTALYGRHITHCSIRYYAMAAPRLTLALPSFAVVRDPVDRFLSAYRYARAGGGTNRVSPSFRALYQGFRSLDDALDHVERARSPYRVDHIFRPQAWFVRDRGGRIAVDYLIPYDCLDRIGEKLPGFPVAALPHLNRAEGETPAPTLAQLERLRMLYATDFALADVAAERFAG